jgi:hypothetical protein
MCVTDRFSRSDKEIQFGMDIRVQKNGASTRGAVLRCVHVLSANIDRSVKGRVYYLR